MDHTQESVNAIVFSDDRKKVLLVKRRDVPVWVLPGGGIDKGESPEIAAVREMFEETGYQVKILKKIAEYTPKCHLARFTHFYECSIIKGKATLSNETQGIDFFMLDDLPLIPPPYPDWIQDAADNVPDLLKKIIFNVTYINLIKYFFLHPILVTRFLLTKIGIVINDK